MNPAGEFALTRGGLYRKKTIMTSNSDLRELQTYHYYPADQLPLQADVPGARFFEVSLNQSMLTYFELEPGAWFPEHSHESEQITLVLSVNLRFEIGGEEVVVGPQEAIAIPSNVPHSVKSLDAVVAVDAWAPPPERLHSRRQST